MHYIPAGQASVTPYLLVRDAKGLIDFLQIVFNASVGHISRTPDNRIMHADIIVDASHIMIGEASDQWPEISGAVYIYVPDVDACYKRALDEGATSIYEPADHFYGDRGCGVRAPAGTTFWISTHIEDVSPEEMEKRQAAHLASLESK